MANTAADIQKLYIAYFNRPADPAGLAYWTASSMTITQIANSFAEQTEYKAAFAGQTTESIIATLYTNLFGSARVPDAAGLLYWVGQVNQGKSTLGNVAINILSGAQGDDKIAVDSKLAAATSFTTAVDTSAEIVAYSKPNGVALAKTWLNGVTTAATATAAIATQDTTIAAIVDASATGVVLTNGTDKVNGAIFEAGLVYTPGGDDRINSLQSEDVLSGTGTNGKNTLNAVLGNSNDNGSSTVTPTLNNVQKVNVDATGNTTELDLRNADDITTLSINKLTNEASSGFTFSNISTNKSGGVANDLTVKNSSAVAGTVAFKYVDGALGKEAALGVGGDSTKINVSNVTLTNLSVGQGSANNEGFEQVELTSTGSNKIKNTTFVDLENLTIKGSGSLSMVNTDTSANTEKVTYTASGLGIGNGIGIRTIDATGFTGNVNLDITNALGGFNDPANSGAKFYSSTKMGAGNDVLWTNKAATGTTTLKDKIDGGDGADTLRTYAGVGSNAVITNVETLEMRGASATADLSSFDAALTKAILRDEVTNGAETFTLNKVGATLASSGNIELRHSVTSSNTSGSTLFNGDTVKVSLKDASGTDDKVAITVVNDLNTGTTYNYIVNTDSANATGTVENLTINDNDTESNNVTLSSVGDYTKSVTLTGGVAAQNYKVAGTIIAKTLDASAQKSNLTLTVGKADQTIKLGSGNDLLTFDGLDTLNGTDTLSDAGGTDTVRAAFSKDVAGTPSLDGIEKLHIIANANTTIDLVKATGITELAILSDIAVDSANEIFTSAVTGVAITDIITLKNTNLASINFFGDTDGSAADGGDDNSGKDSTDYTQTFNGLTLENNASATVAVNIAAPLANGADSSSSGDGVKAYNLGQLTTHGVTDLSITVKNEYDSSEDEGDYTTATTTIANIWDRDLVNLTLTAGGNVNVGTVTGNTVNSNIKTFNASAVGGKTTAVVKALGDNAVVTLAAGDDSFNALGSAGNNVVINGGDGKNTITGTAQSDYIYTGSGNDVIHADRGNNTVKSGAGNDTVDALNGSNTVDLGSGWSDKVTFNYDTVGQQNLATNVVAGSGTSAVIGFDNNNDATVDTTFGFAVGAGSELSVKFVGTTFDSVASTLNGRSTTVSAANAFAGVEANLSNLLVATTAGGINLTTVAGGSAADVFLDYRDVTAAADDYDVSLGAGNDSIVISQLSTGKHTITGGTGADRVYLSAAAGADTVVIGENESTAAGWDVITNFAAGAGADVLDLSGTPTAGVTANLTSTTFSTTGPVTASAVGGAFSLSAGVIGVDYTVASVLTFLANNATVSGDVFFFQYDSNGSGAIDAADNVVVFQNLGTDIVVELVGGNGNNVNGLVIGDIA
nr:DUF4214 domain-containing protein [uncultured Undibacterium sp.]